MYSCKTGSKYRFVWLEGGILCSGPKQPYTETFLVTGDNGIYTTGTSLCVGGYVPFFLFLLPPPIFSTSYFCTLILLSSLYIFLTNNARGKEENEKYLSPLLWSLLRLRKSGEFPFKYEINGFILKSHKTYCKS